MRGRIFWLALAALTLAFLADMWASGYWLARLDGTPRVFDFGVYWTASHLALSGNPSALYDAGSFHALEQSTFGQTIDSSLLYSYPPTSLLFIWPFRLLPYTTAWLAFELVGALIWAFVLHRIVRDWSKAIGMALALGAATHTIFQGQNGFYTASLLIGSLLTLPHDKRLSGVLLGLLSFKPQLAGPALLGFILWREWRAARWSIATGGALILLSGLIFGAQPWFDFLHAAPGFAAIHESRATAEASVQLQTIFAMLAPAIGMRALLAQLAIGAMALILAGRVDGVEQRAAALVAAVTLTTPFAFLYDLTMLTGACALLLRNARNPIETCAICLAGAFPALWFYSPGSVGPISASLLLGLTWYQSRQQMTMRGTQGDAAAPRPSSTLNMT